MTMTVTPRLLAIEREMVGDIYTSRSVMQILESLCDECGSRFAGSESEKAAKDFILASFNEFEAEVIELRGR